MLPGVPRQRRSLFRQRYADLNEICARKKSNGPLINLETECAEYQVQRLDQDDLVDKNANMRYMEPQWQDDEVCDGDMGDVENPVAPSSHEG